MKYKNWYNLYCAFSIRHPPTQATALTIVSYFGLESAVRSLICKGSKAHGSYGSTPLWYAAENGHHGVSKILLANGASTLASGGDGNLTPLLRACKRGDEQMARLLLRYHKDIEIQDNDGRSPLSIAVEGGYEDIVRMLLDKKANIDVKDNLGVLPLLRACELGNESMVQLLLEYGANNESQDRGQSALWIAAEAGNEDIFKMLFEKGANIEAKYDYEDTPLLRACRHRAEPIVRLLLRYGANVEARNVFGQTALHLSTMACDEWIVMLLLEHGAQIDAEDGPEGPSQWVSAATNDHGTSLTTPLSIAIRMGHRSIITLLLRKLAQIDSTYRHGLKPLLIAIEKNDTRSVSLFIDSGVEINCNGEDGQTPLGLAVEKITTKIVQLLLDRGADMQSNIRGQNPLLYLALERKQTRIATMLINKMAQTDPSTVTPEEKCLLFMALQAQHFEAALLLVDQGADIQWLPEQVQNLMRYAVHNGSERMVQLLLNKGANAQMDVEPGIKAVSFASMQGHRKIVNLLEEAGGLTRAIHCSVDTLPGSS